MFLVPPRRGWMVQSDGSLSWRDVPFLDSFSDLSLLRTNSATRVCETMWILLFVVRKSPFSLPPLQLIFRSNSWEISVPLAMHNPPLLLYLYISETLPSWITIFLILYLLRLIPLTLLLTYFSPFLTFSWPSILLQSLPVISTIFLSAFAWLPRCAFWSLWSHAPTVPPSMS